MQAKMLETEEDYIYDLVRTLVIHSVLAVLTNRRDNLIKVLYLLLTSPESLKVKKIQKVTLLTSNSSIFFVFINVGKFYPRNATYYTKDIQLWRGISK